MILIDEGRQQRAVERVLSGEIGGVEHSHRDDGSWGPKPVKKRAAAADEGGKLADIARKHAAPPPPPPAAKPKPAPKPKPVPVVKAAKPKPKRKPKPKAPPRRGGEFAHQAKLTVEKVELMRILVANGSSMRAAGLAVAPEVKYATAVRAIQGITWKNMRRKEAPASAKILTRIEM